MPAKAPKFGHMNCPTCEAAKKTTRILVRRKENGTLSAQCDECDSTEYAQAGTGKHATWTARITVIDGAAPAADASTSAKKSAPAADASTPEKKSKYGSYA